MAHKLPDTETHYRLLKLLEQDSEISQRELAAELGISLGKANYCLRALIHAGWVKVSNFQRSRNKSAYLYQLTPRGIAEKTDAARRFLRSKQDEHERIREEIRALQSELQGQGAVEEGE